MPDPQNYSYLAQFVKMLFSLGAIIGFIFVSLWFLKKFLRSKATHLNQSTAIKVLEKRMLHPKASIYLIDVLGKGIVISETTTGIHPITEFPPDVDVTLLCEQIQENVASPSFAETLKKLIAFKKKATTRE